MKKIIEVKEKPKFPIKVEMRIVDGKLSPSPNPSEFTPEQKKLVGEYSKKFRAYKRWKIGGKTINMLINMLEREKALVVELKKKIKSTGGIKAQVKKAEQESKIRARIEKDQAKLVNITK